LNHSLTGSSIRGYVYENRLGSNGERPVTIGKVEKGGGSGDFLKGIGEMIVVTVVVTAVTELLVRPFWEGFKKEWNKKKV
jgi:hypothetical protein